MLRIVLILSGVGWLVSNHYLPWLASWNDGVSIAWLLFASGGALWNARSTPIRLSIFLVGFVGLSMIAIVIQILSGKIIYAGDGLMAILYVTIFFLAIILGKNVGMQASQTYTNLIVIGWILAALMTVFVALNQWMGLFDLGMWSVEIHPAGRPSGNVAQPNNFSTLCFIGLCSVFLLGHRFRLNGVAVSMLAGAMLCGIVASQSRTGILQVAFFMPLLLIFQRRLGLKISRITILGLGAFFSFLVVLWPRISSFLLLANPRAVADDIGGNVRLQYWEAMAQAILKAPLWGYGWNQVGSAQQMVALENPPLFSYFEHAHNIWLDLLLWNGVPVGGALIVIFLWWCVQGVLRKMNPEKLILWGLLAGVLIHGMLEFPLEYAYILIPVGLVIGWLDADNEMVIRLPARTALYSCAAVSICFAFVVKEYLKMEEGLRTLRIESARIGVPGISTAPPTSWALNQLSEFQWFVATEARRGMRREEIERMQKVASRFGYAPVIFRYSIALGLNGDWVRAANNLRLMCSIQREIYCKEARQNWATLQVEYPELKRVEF